MNCEKVRLAISSFDYDHSRDRSAVFQSFAEFSLRNFPVPNIDDFLQRNETNVNTDPIPLPSLDDVTLPRNQWYFHHDESLEYRSAANAEVTSDDRDADADDGAVDWQVVVMFLLAVDVAWFVHRLARSVLTARKILNGVEVFVDADQSGAHKRSSTQS